MSVRLDYRDRREPALPFWKGALWSLVFGAWLWTWILVLTTS